LTTLRGKRIVSIMPTRTYTDDQLLEYSGEHLLYELQIFRWVKNEAQSQEQPSFLLSALLESFAIHLRNLTDFLFTLPKDARTDDIVAADYFDSPGAWTPGNRSTTLGEAQVRANKEISHITYKRKDSTDITKPWPVADLFDEIDSISKNFAREASGQKLHSKVVEFLNADAKTVGILLISASTSTSNTCAQVVSVNPTGKSGNSTI
jgi:hypothetical protein